MIASGSACRTSPRRRRRADDVRDGAARAAGLAQENPLGLAIGSVAVGFLVGLAMPATRVENERLGPIADEVKEQAMHTGQEALGHVREVAQDAAAGAVAAAQESGHEHADELKTSAQDSVEHVKDAAQSPRVAMSNSHVSCARAPAHETR